MARKREKKKSELEIFSFGIDRNDPKYAQLLQFLMDAEAGSRSFIIRQVLNSYVLGQSSAGTVSLLPQNPVVARPPVQEPLITPIEPVQPTVVEDKIPEVIEDPIVEKTQPVQVESVETKDPTPQKTLPVQPVETVNEFIPEKKVKPKKNSKLSSLASTFQ